MLVNRSSMTLALAFSALLAGCGDGNDSSSTGGSGGSTASGGSGGAAAAQDVMDIGVREVVDQATFDMYFPEVVALSQKQPGFVTSRDFLSFYSLAPDPMPKNPIRVGLTQWSSADDYMAAAGTLVSDPLWSKYFPSVKGISSVLVKPYKEGEKVDVANIIGPNQVLEVAIRDLSKVGDHAAFFAAKDAFIKVLTSAKGVIHEYEWVSATPNDDYYVGMTQYESQAAFSAVASDPAIVKSPEAAAFFTNYPPMVAQITMAAP